MATCERPVMTQKDRVKAYMQEYGIITPIDAFRDLGITKLATVISGMIRNDNEQIEKVWTASKNRWGEPVYYMAYKLKDEDGRNQVDKTGHLTV